MDITFIKCNTPSLPPKNDLQATAMGPDIKPSSSGLFLSSAGSWCLAPLALPGGTVGGGEGPAHLGLLGLDGVSVTSS